MTSENWFMGANGADPESGIIVLANNTLNHGFPVFVLHFNSR
jgi:hypothetical protein